MIHKQGKAKGVIAAVVVLMLGTGCQIEPGDEVLSFTRRRYESDLAAPTRSAPRDGLYRLYSTRAPGRLLGEVRLTKGAEFGFREKAGIPHAFGQQTVQSENGSTRPADVEIPLNPALGEQRYFWMYEGQ